MDRGEREEKRRKKVIKRERKRGSLTDVKQGRRERSLLSISSLRAAYEKAFILFLCVLFFFPSFSK